MGVNYILPSLFYLLEVFHEKGVLKSACTNMTTNMLNNETMHILYR